MSRWRHRTHERGDDVTGLHSVIQPGPDGGPLRIRLSSLDSGGELGVVEMEMPAGSAGPPLHIHPTHGEGFYVLDGQLTLQIGQEIIAEFADLAPAERATQVTGPPIPPPNPTHL